MARRVAASEHGTARSALPDGNRMSVSRPHPSALVATTTRGSSANAPHHAGGQQRHAGGEPRDQGRARSSMTQRPTWDDVHAGTSVAGHRCAAHRRTRRNARAQRSGWWRWALRCERALSLRAPGSGTGSPSGSSTRLAATRPTVGASTHVPAGSQR